MTELTYDNNRAQPDDSEFAHISTQPAVYAGQDSISQKKAALNCLQQKTISAADSEDEPTQNNEDMAMVPYGYTSDLLPPFHWAQEDETEADDTEAVTSARKPRSEPLGADTEASEQQASDKLSAITSEVNINPLALSETLKPHTEQSNGSEFFGTLQTDREKLPTKSSEHTEEQKHVTAEASGRASPPERKPLPDRLPCKNQGQWHLLAEAVAGLSHRNAQPALPCQDSALTRQKTRPVIALADGAGSSAVSDIGAQAITLSMQRFIETMEKTVASLLDDTADSDCQQDKQDQSKTQRFALLLVKHAKGVLNDLSQQHRRPLKDFRCTLQIVIIGTTRTLWLKVGDGEIITEHMMQLADSADSDAPRLRPQLNILGGNNPEEFANHTAFIDEDLSLSAVQTGVIPSAPLSGIACMSDGTAEKLVSTLNRKVSGQLSHWLNQLRQARIDSSELTRAFYSDKFIENSSGDDCSLVLAAAELSLR